MALSGRERQRRYRERHPERCAESVRRCRKLHCYREKKVREAKVWELPCASRRVELAFDGSWESGWFRKEKS